MLKNYFHIILTLTNNLIENCWSVLFVVKQRPTTAMSILVGGRLYFNDYSNSTSDFAREQKINQKHISIIT